MLSPALHTGLSTAQCLSVEDAESGSLPGHPQAVLWIQIRLDPELLPGSRSRIIVPDPDPAKYERADE